MENKKDNTKEEIRQRMKEDVPIPIITENLADEGHSYNNIEDAINSSSPTQNLKPSIMNTPIKHREEILEEEPNEPIEDEIPAPTPQAQQRQQHPPQMHQMQQAPRIPPAQQTQHIPRESQLQRKPAQIDYPQTDLDQIEELIEAVVEEKWRSLIENFGNIGLWKNKIQTEVSSIKQELMRVENRLEDLQKAVLGKVDSYDKHIVEVNSEIKALEKVFQKIMDPLTTNIKELNKITQKLKRE